MTDSADIKLVPLATATIAAGDRFKIDDGPFGNRVIAGIRTGRWEGDRLRGTIVGPGADWAMPGPGGAMLLDVRQVVQTDDGAVIYVTYHGRADRTRGTYTIAPTFETSDERYVWLNAVQAVGKGRLTDAGIVYEIYEVR
ncbi:MAG: DUF3237 domain-containing protein [Ilumatobacteraceae bacterium]|nr:DUF3237 domain-containing protein [Ilumatobacteraceae bacterium]